MGRKVDAGCRPTRQRDTDPVPSRWRRLAGSGCWLLPFVLVGVLAVGRLVDLPAGRRAGHVRRSQQLCGVPRDGSGAMDRLGPRSGDGPGHGRHRAGRFQRRGVHAQRHHVAHVSRRPEVHDPHRGTRRADGGLRDQVHVRRPAAAAVHGGVRSAGRHAGVRDCAAPGPADLVGHRRRSSGSTCRRRMRRSG